MSQTMPRPLPDVEFKGKVRARDTETSWDAAEKQTNNKTLALQNRLWLLLRLNGPMTDDELYAKYSGHDKVKDGRWPGTSPSAVRSRRKTLELKGRVQWRGNEKRPSAQGNPSRVWEVKP